MLSELRIRNFKCLRDTGVLQIRPLTILIGPNSSGKSSVIQFLLMLKQTAISRDYRNPLIFDDDCIKLESYRNIIWKNKININLEFEFSLEKMARRGPSWLLGDVKHRVVFYRKQPRVAGIHSFEMVNKKDNRVILSIIWGQEYPEPSVKDSVFRKDITKALFKNLFFVKFYPVIYPPLSPRETRRLSKYERWAANVIRAMRYFDAYFSRNICYLAPLREFPRRYYPISGATLEDIGFMGERTVEVLTGSKEISHSVRKWVKKFGLARGFRIKAMRKKTLAEVILKDPALSLDVNLYDTGFGISQILPIIVEGFYAPEESVLLIEQPEIHLHPKLQADVGDLLIEISRTKKKLIVETHSEHLLLRIQRRIAEGILDPKDIAIYYFDLASEGSQITRMKIEKTGKIENWPEGFFEEDVIETMAFTKAYIKNVKRDNL